MNIYAGVSEERKSIIKKAVEDCVKNNLLLVIPDHEYIMEQIYDSVRGLGLFEQCEIYTWREIVFEDVKIESEGFIYLFPELILAEVCGFTTDDDCYYAPYAIYTDSET